MYYGMRISYQTAEMKQREIPRHRDKDICKIHSRVRIKVSLIVFQAILMFETCVRRVKYIPSSPDYM